MKSSLTTLSRSVLIGAAALALSAVACVGMPTAAQASGPIPCKLDWEGHGCAGQGDPWVANLFSFSGMSGPDAVFVRKNGEPVTFVDANNLAKYLGYSRCYPASYPTDKIKKAICEQ